MREAFLTGGTEGHVTEETLPAELNLTKAKLEGAGLYVEYTSGEADGAADFTVHHKRPVHPDLLKAFARLVPHLCLLCDLVQGVRQDDEFFSAEQLFYALPPGGPELHERVEFASFKVTGVTWSTTGVVLVGQKRYRSGKKVLNLVSPHEALDPEMLTGQEYEHLYELRAELGRFEAEARLYLGGKSGAADVVQGALNFDAVGDAAEKGPFGPLSDILAEADDLAKKQKARKSGKDAAAGDDTGIY